MVNKYWTNCPQAKYSVTLWGKTDTLFIIMDKLRRIQWPLLTFSSGFSLLRCSLDTSQQQGAMRGNCICKKFVKIPVVGSFPRPASPELRLSKPALTYYLNSGGGRRGLPRDQDKCPGLNTAISRKVVGKNVHATILKGSMDMINTLFLTIVAVESNLSLFCCFSL